MVLFARKAWLLSKKYWYVVLVLVVGIVWAVAKLGSKREKAKLLDWLEKQRDFHDKELKVIEEVREEEREKKRVAVEKYKETIEKIETEHGKEKAKLTRKKRKEIKRIIEENVDNNDKLAEELAKSMGFEVIKIED